MAFKINSIQFKRALKQNLPASALEGEPLVTTDTDELYIGQGENQPLKQLTIKPSNLYVHLTSTASFPSATWTAIPYSTVVYDDLSEFDTTQKAFIPKESGMYSVSGFVRFNSTAASDAHFYIMIYVNNSGKFALHAGNALAYQGAAFSDIIKLNAGDKVEIRVYPNVARTTEGATPHSNNYLKIHRLS